MGVSTDGQICYGIKFEEGYEFPWDSEKWEGDIEEWWLREVHGYENPFELFDESGEWINGVEAPEAKVNEYFDDRDAFREKHPKLPIEIVNYCSGDFPMYILAVPDSCQSARRGYPEPIHPLSLIPYSSDDLLEFCKQHDIEVSDEPKWWLSSYWG